MITITDRKYNVLTQLSFDLPGGLLAYDDWFEQDLETGISTYEFTVDKTDNAVGLIRIGCYVFVNDRAFEIMTTDEDNDSKLIYCEDAGLDLLGEQVGEYSATTSQPITTYIQKFIYDSGWEIGVNELPNTVTRKLSWDGVDSATKRLRQLAKRFGVELSYSVQFREGKIFKRLINIYNRIGKDNKVRLEYGVEVSKIRKRESIENLATGLIGVGQGEGNQKITLLDYDIPSQYKPRYEMRGEVLVDNVEGVRWSRHGDTSDGFIVKYYDSEAKSQKELFEATVNQLKKRVFPENTYEVSIELVPEQINIGDSVVIVDHDYKPALVIDGRVSKIKRSFFDETVGEVTISNIIERRDSLDVKVEQMSKLLKETVLNAPIMIEMTSSNGTVFTDGNLRTKLSVSVTKNGLDVTNQYSYQWKRESRYNTTLDGNWNMAHRDGTSELTISNADVNEEARFICEVYDTHHALIGKKSLVIKDFLVERYKQSTPPQNAENGALWTDTSTLENILKVKKNDEWVPVVNNELQEQYNNQMAQIVSDITDLYASVETKLTEKDFENLNGKYSDLKKSYEELKTKANEITGLGERVTAFEVNVQQSQALINALSTHFSFSEEGMLIGKDDSSLKLLANNDRLSFIDGGKEVAYISNQQMYILSGVFVESLIVANHKIEKLGKEFTVFSYVGG